jgi:hypothetical protein
MLSRWLASSISAIAAVTPELASIWKTSPFGSGCRPSRLSGPHPTSVRATGGAFAQLPVGAKASRISLSRAGSAPAPASFPAAGALTLVSFLATQPDSAATSSRSQAVELVSIADQYGRKGVHVLIVDISPSKQR